MTKYDSKIRSIRGITRKEVPKLLKKKSKNIDEIFVHIKKIAGKEICDDNEFCSCGRLSQRPEWKHQIRWGLVDLKYANRVTFDKNTNKYSTKMT